MLPFKSGRNICFKDKNCSIFEGHKNKNFMRWKGENVISSPSDILCVYARLCPSLCNPMDCSPAGSSVRGISQAWVPEWVAILFSRGCSLPRNRTHVCCISYLGRRFFMTALPGKSSTFFTKTKKPSLPLPLQSTLLMKGHFRLRQLVCRSRGNILGINVQCPMRV